MTNQKRELKMPDVTPWISSLILPGRRGKERGKQRAEANT